MAASYPSSIKTFTTKVVSDVIQAAHINDLQAEVTAIETGLKTSFQHDLLFTDATYDIGKTGATRPRDLFLSRNLTVGGTASITGAIVSNLIFTDNTYDIGAAGATRPKDIHLAGDLKAGDQLFERARTVALGEWANQAFSAGNFTASGSMTWTVAEADQDTFRYTLIGKTMIVDASIVTTTVGGTPSTALRITLPASATAASAASTACSVRDNGTFSVGWAEVAASGTYISIYLAAQGNWAASTDATDVRLQIAVEIT